jgi:bifunctional non-homologous end joining protein LigD
VAPREDEGTAAGMLFTTQALLPAAIPVLGRCLGDRYGLLSVFHVIAATVLVVTIALVFVPDIPPRRALAPEAPAASRAREGAGRKPMSRAEYEDVAAGGRTVAVSNPHKVLFPVPGYTKLDLVRYYLAVADGALRAAGGRPTMLVRYPDGVGSDFFYQKRAPRARPPWIEVVRLRFPSGRTADEVVPRDAAALVWLANLACLELHPHPVRAEDLDHPDELRIDLDPGPGVGWADVQAVADVVHATLRDLAIMGWPKTSGGRGMHILVRLEPRWPFDDVRRAALALAREVERRIPDRATSKWWKEERHGVFIDYNQNAKDRTVAAAYSVRPTPDARVSAPLAWDEVDRCDPSDFTMATVPGRFAASGDRHEGIDGAPCSLVPLLELAARQADAGLGEAPWPPHYRKQAGEPLRAQPSRVAKQVRGERPTRERPPRRHG